MSIIRVQTCRSCSLCNTLSPACIRPTYSEHFTQRYTHTAVCCDVTSVYNSHKLSPASRADVTRCVVLYVYTRIYQIFATTTKSRACRRGGALNINDMTWQQCKQYFIDRSRMPQRDCPASYRGCCGCCCGWFITTALRALFYIDYAQRDRRFPTKIDDIEQLQPFQGRNWNASSRDRVYASYIQSFAELHFATGELCWNQENAITVSGASLLWKFY